MSRPPTGSPREVHHALLNHIAVVSTYAHLMNDSQLDQEQRDILDELASSIDEAHSLAVELGRKLKIHPRSDNATGGPA